MKHSPVLILGVATLALSSAPTYAKEPLNFDLPVSRQSVSYTSYTTVSQPTDRARKINSETPPIDRTESFKPATNLPNLPLFELPPFQSDSSSDSSNQSDIVSSKSEDTGNSQNNDAQPDLQSLVPEASNSYSSSKPSVSEPSNERSPFVLPDELSDADLFESGPVEDHPVEDHPVEDHPVEKRETDSFDSDSLFRLPSPEPKQQEPRLPESRSQDSTLQSDPEFEFETRSDVQNPASVERFESNQRNDRPVDLPNRTESNQTEQNQTESNQTGNDNDSAPLAKIDSPDRSFDDSSRKGSIGLDFDPPNHASSSLIAKPAAAPIPVESPASSQSDIAVDKTSLDYLFKGDSDSLVAVAVGSAEGTRTPDGGKNPAYQGHTDPGNGVWNLGSFSYQHGASSPEEADAKQLARLRTQAQMILDMAAAKGLDLTLEEKLNGIDLANQAPKAALDEYGGYIDWLVEARTSGLGGTDAILWARVHSFLDPHTKTWNAPGLGNSEERITSDQERRMLAIAKAIATYMQDLANRPPAKAADEQAFRQRSTENQSVARLFMQKAMRWFEYSVGEKHADANEPELPIVQQILGLDLSGLMAA